MKENILLDYQNKCVELAIYSNIGNNHLYTYLGLSGEFGEFYEKVRHHANYDIYCIEEKKELGDVFWYYVMLCYELKIDLSLDVFDFSDNFDYMIHDDLEKVFKQISKLAEIFKKVIRDDTIIINRQVGGIMHVIITILCGYILYRNWDIEEILDMNIDKLKDRQSRNVLHGSGDNR